MATGLTAVAIGDVDRRGPSDLSAGGLQSILHRSFAEMHPDDQVAPIPAIRGALIEPRKRPKGSLDDLIGGRGADRDTLCRARGRPAGRLGHRDSTLPLA
jgi:hypothetical protein